MNTEHAREIPVHLAGQCCPWPRRDRDIVETSIECFAKVFHRDRHGRGVMQAISDFQRNNRRGPRGPR